MKSDVLREHAASLLNKWANDAGASPIRLLEGINLDTAVARGATYYGLAKTR